MVSIYQVNPSLQEVQSAGSSKKQLIVALLYTSEVALSLAAQETVWL